MLAQFFVVFMIAFVLLLLGVVGMAIGYIIKKQPLKGSCGGVANLMGDEYCQFCGNDPNKCNNSAIETKPEHSNS